MQFVVAGHGFELDPRVVERTLERQLPDPIQEHYVVVGGRRFPPKQVLACVTGLDRADFTTHQARRILMRLGFAAARARKPDAEAGERRPGEGPHQGRQAEALRPHRGQWVALGEPTEVLVAADTPQAVLTWLTVHGRTASGMFRVPGELRDAEGSAPA
jgi:hypothetical protein